MKKQKGITDQVLALRAAKEDPIVLGQWHAGFSRMLAYAEDKGLPLIGVWTNGDDCSLCVKFEKNLLSSTFQKWMRESGCLFWFGTSSDADKDDSVVGKTWTKAGKLRTYPFVRVCVKKGDVIVADYAESGNKICKGKLPEVGAQNIIAKFEEVLGEKPARLLNSSKYKIIVNPELTKEEELEIRQAIKDNDGYCPCQEGQTPETKCMCQDFRDHANEEYTCICDLYRRVKK